MKILPFDIQYIENLSSTDLQDLVDEESNYSVVDWRKLERPSNSWAMPYVTGHRYRIHWGEGLDFDRMDFELSERWEENDKPILINLNFTDSREAINVTKALFDQAQTPEGTINDNYLYGFTGAPNLETGDNYLIPAKKEFEFAVNGVNSEKNRMRLTGI